MKIATKIKINGMHKDIEFEGTISELESFSKTGAKNLLEAIKILNK